MTDHQFSLSLFGQLVAANNHVKKPKEDHSSKKESELQVLRFALLEQFDRAEELSAKILSEMIDYSVFTIASMIKKMTNAGLLKFKRQAKINKTVQNFYCITQKGRDELAKHNQTICAGKSSSEQVRLS